MPGWRNLTVVDFDYLAKGLYAMARAHLVNPMAGHLGAGIVSGFFITENQPNLDEYVCSGIEAELDRIIRGQSTFSPKKMQLFQWLRCLIRFRSNRLKKI
jgi:hypothetical protein